VGVQLTATNTAVVLDSTADLARPGERHANWHLVPLYVRFGDETLRDYVDLTPEDFYARLRASSEQPKTSQPTPGDFEELFRRLAEYERVLCLLVSSRVSGTYETARMVADATAPERVVVVDTRSVSAGSVILADAVQRRLDRGATDEEIAALVDRFRAEARIIFTLETLEYLVRGGRVGKAAGLAGQLLNVKPILAITDGEVVPLKRVRGRAKALAEFERLFVEGTDDEPGLHVALAHAEARAEMDELARRIRAARPNASLDVETTLGPVVGTHAGPGTLGLFWFRDDA
jgi:DegV family protein with EDD domain